MKRIVRGLVVLVVLLIGPTVQAHEGHEHTVDETSQEAGMFIDPSLLGFSGLQEVFNTHPAFVHFPLALFPSALLLYGLGIVFKRSSWTVAGRACLYLAAAGTAVTVLTGWQAQETFPHNERVHHMMMTHLRIGLAIGALACVLVLWSFIQHHQRPKGIYGFLFVLALTTYLVLQNGDLGSRMVYLEGAAVRPAISAMTGGYVHGHEEDKP